ncbi:hypothetical protein ABW21_db0205500 [Orbilia brochopaga]|nr:hypothetical protein ABW21_db0205500 [Drechslerella brochopaga]
MQAASHGDTPGGVSGQSSNTPGGVSGQSSNEGTGLAQLPPSQEAASARSSKRRRRKKNRVALLAGVENANSSTQSVEPPSQDDQGAPKSAIETFTSWRNAVHVKPSFPPNPIVSDPVYEPKEPPFELRPAAYQQPNTRWPIVVGNDMYPKCKPYEMIIREGIYRRLIQEYVPGVKRRPCWLDRVPNPNPHAHRRDDPDYLPDILPVTEHHWFPEPNPTYMYEEQPPLDSVRFAALTPWNRASLHFHEHIAKALAYLEREGLWVDEVFLIAYLSGDIRHKKKYLGWWRTTVIVCCPRPEKWYGVILERAKQAFWPKPMFPRAVMVRGRARNFYPEDGLVGVYRIDEGKYDELDPRKAFVRVNDDGMDDGAVPPEAVLTDAFDDNINSAPVNSGDYSGNNVGAPAVPVDQHGQPFAPNYPYQQGQPGVSVNGTVYYNTGPYDIAPVPVSNQYMPVPVGDPYGGNTYVVTMLDTYGAPVGTYAYPGLLSGPVGTGYSGPVDTANSGSGNTGYRRPLILNGSGIDINSGPASTARRGPVIVNGSVNTGYGGPVDTTSTGPVNETSAAPVDNSSAAPANDASTSVVNTRDVRFGDTSAGAINNETAESLYAQQMAEDSVQGDDVNWWTTSTGTSAGSNNEGASGSL